MDIRKYFIGRKTGKSIEAEEIFLDAEAVRSMQEKGKMEHPVKNRNFFVFYLFILICLLGLLLRAGYLQAIKGDYYLDLAQGNRLRIYPITAPRGLIYDYKLQPLVFNTASFDLIVDIADFLDNDEQTQEEILTEITNFIGLESSGDLREKIEDAYGRTGQIILVKSVERGKALVLEGMVNEWPGMRLENNIIRDYLQAPYFAHVLGYTGEVNSDDLARNPDYFLGSQIGKTGLEFQYDNLLRGESGKRQIEVDSIGKTQKLLATQPPQPGNSLVLHLDKNLQEVVYQSLEAMLKKLKLKKAVVVAINPNNGGVLSLVSLPSFDNNLFTRDLSQESLETLEQDANEPFLNRAVAGQYPSGSTIKPLIGAAALQEKIISPFQKINCAGNISIVNKYNPEIVYNFPDWKVHGLTDIIKAIAESCNTFFYAVGGGYNNVKGLGIGRIKKYLQLFGLGQITNIDFPNENSGLVPDAEWKKEVKSEEWGLGDTYHVSIGQGDILVTPVQMASAIASVANNGILYQPQLVDKIVDLDGNIVEDIKPYVIREDFVDENNLAVVRKGMREAVISGSSRALADLPVSVAGKTGTAQFGEEQLHSWFVSFAPYDNPQIVLVVLIEGGGEGHSAAVPVAKEILEWYFKQRTANNEQ